MPATDIFGICQTADQAGNSVTRLDQRRGFASGSGNLLIAWNSLGTTGTTVQATDNINGTTGWTQVETITRGQKLQLWINTAGSAGVTDVWWALGGSNHASGGWAEMCGVKLQAPESHSNASSASNATITCGTLGTVTVGSFIFAVAVQDSSSADLASFTPDTGYDCYTADLHWTFVTTFGKIYASGSKTPQTVMNTARGWCAAAMSLVVDTSVGTACPTTYPIPHIRQDSSFPSTTPNPFPLQASSVSTGMGITALSLMTSMAPGVSITGVTDNHSNTWNQIGTGLSAGQAGKLQAFFADAPAANQVNLASAASSGAPVGNMLTLVSWRNTASTAVPGSLTTKSSNDAAGTSIAGATVTPAASTAMVVQYYAVQSNTTTAASPGLFATPTSTPDVASPAQLFENNALIFNHAGNTTPYNQTYTMNGVPNDYGEISFSVLVGAAIPTPALTSISPITGAQNSVVPVHFVGTDFDQASLSVNVSGTLVTAGTPSSVTATTFDSNFTIDVSAATTARNVTVSTVGGTSGAKTFTVTAQVLSGGGGDSLSISSEVGFTGAIGGSVFLEG